MNETLEKLVRLHVLDLEIKSQRELCNNIPKRIKALEDELSDAQKYVESIKEKIKSNEKIIRSNEKEIENCRQQQGKYRAQLFKLKSNREYQALNAEIELLSKKISDLETDILERMERIDAAKDEETKAVKRLNQEVEKIQKAKEDLKRELEAEREKLEKSEKERHLLKSSIDPEILAHYEKIKKRNGTAVADIISGNCGGCFVRVRPQIAAMVRGNEQVLTCEKCGRYLFWTDQSEE